MRVCVVHETEINRLNQKHKQRRRGTDWSSSSPSSPVMLDDIERIRFEGKIKEKIVGVRLYLACVVAVRKTAQPVQVRLVAFFVSPHTMTPLRLNSSPQ